MARHIYHVHGQPYHTENSIRGIRRAKATGHNAIDLDLQMTADGRIIGCHWGQPMLRDGFRDPLRPLARRARVNDMTWSRVKRLIVPKGRYRIQQLETLLAECARLGIEAVLEPKGDPRFASDNVWRQIRLIQRKTGAKVSVYALTQNRAALAPAKRAGFTAWEIKR